MDLETIEPALATLVAALTGVESGCVVWENALRPRHNGQLVVLSWVTTQGVGVDSETWTFEANADPTQEMTPTVQGARFGTLQLSVESTDQRPGYTARKIAERARTRFERQSTDDALGAVHLALAGVGAVTNADYPGSNDRMVSRCILEVRLNGRAREADTAGRTSYIATVQATAALTRPDGAALDADLQPTGSYP